MDTIKVNPNPEPGMCACGLPLHYTDPEKQKRCQELVDLLGEFIEVVDSKRRRFRVQRHYIALHGIKEVEVAELGFIEIRQAA
jgi:hypothetical protein